MIKTRRNRIILVPRLKNPGGIANYYSVLNPYFSDCYTYINRGKSSGNNKFWRIITDYINYAKFVHKLKTNGIVIISSSLGFGGFIRDGLYTLVTPKKIKKVIFFRGWNSTFEYKINNSRFLKFWMEVTFLKADHIIVLSSNFKKKLHKWGYQGPISLETTVVDEKLVVDLNIHSKKRKGNEILFLSRVEKDKGIFEAVDAVQILLTKYRDIHFKIAGNGSAFEELTAHVSNLNTKRVSLKGYVKGENKIACFLSSHLFLFPSVHGEGMPNSVLEAMAFGLPVITTRVGGIPDFFEEGKMGLFLDNREPEHIAEKIEYLLDRPELMQKISDYNYNYAKEHFYASKVADRLEKIIDNV